MCDSVVQHCLNMCPSSLHQRVQSQLQHKVERALRRLGYTVESEKPILSGLKRLDLVVTLKTGINVGIEVDGPSHFFGAVTDATAPILSANTRLRNRIVRRAVKQMVPHCNLAPLPFTHFTTLSYLDWSNCGGNEQREILLLETLLSEEVLLRASNQSDVL